MHLQQARGLGGFWRRGRRGGRWRVPIPRGECQPSREEVFSVFVSSAIGIGIEQQLHCHSARWMVSNCSTYRPSERRSILPREAPGEGLGRRVGVGREVEFSGARGFVPNVGLELLNRLAERRSILAREAPHESVDGGANSRGSASLRH